jgi:hypothetical protein
LSCVSSFVEGDTEASLAWLAWAVAVRFPEGCWGVAIGRGWGVSNGDSAIGVDIDVDTDGLLDRAEAAV